MIRLRLIWLKHLLYALVVLALLGGLAEVGLRVYDSATGQVTRRELFDRGMVCKSWFRHHTLKPSQTFQVRNPDTRAVVPVVLNSLGLRGDEPQIPKPPGVFRVLCLGDDTTLAQHIPESATFCRQLQQILQARAPGRMQVEVINAGTPGYCPLLSLLQMRQELLVLQPDLCVLNFDMSDVSDDYQYRRHTALGAMGLPLSCAHPALVLTRAPARSHFENLFLLPGFVKERAGCLCAEKILADSSQSISSLHGRYAWLQDQPPDWSHYIAQALSPLVELNGLLQGGYTGLIVAVSPAPWQVSAEASNGAGVRERVGVGAAVIMHSRRPFKIIGEYCQAHNLPLCDTSPAFQQAERGERLFLTNAAALSSEGHALYARELAAMILRHNPHGIWEGTEHPTSKPPPPRQALAAPP